MTRDAIGRLAVPRGTGSRVDPRSPGEATLREPDHPALTADQLEELFAELDTTHFHPHPFTREEAERIASHSGADVYAILEVDGRPVAYGMLRGWDEGYEVPSLGIAVRRDAYRQGHGRAMMDRLHAIARDRRAPRIRLRVHPDNLAARALYESLGYREAGEERGEIVMVLEV